MTDPLRDRRTRRAKRASSTDAIPKEPPTDAGSGTRPTLPNRGSVDSVLLEYLTKPTAPNMQAVKVPVQIHGVDPARMSSVPTVPPREEPKQAPPPPPARSAAYEDERPTGKWAVSTPPADPRELVRDRGVLVRLDGDASGEVLSLPRGIVEVGRSTRAQVHVVDPSVSRGHARIVYEYGTYFVEDLGSQNGTLLAGRRVNRAELRDGDLVQFGQHSTFRFALMDQTQEQVMRRLYDSSMRDPLTGADNRRHLESRLQAEIAFAMRHKRPLSVILLDIDFFKVINDRHGHPAGDQVLREVARLVRSQLRTEDAFARYGGEEFAIVLRDTAVKEATHVAERVRGRIARDPIELGETAVVEVSVSAGCASLTCCVGTTTEELIGVADRRLYRAKRAGRNRVVSKDDD